VGKHTSKESEIKIIALPSGPNGIQTSNATYTWRLNNQTQKDQSGYKKNSFIFSLTTTEKEDTVGVTSTTTSGDVISSGEIKLSGINPFILFYKKSPSEGVLYNKIIPKEFFMSEDEITINAEPYFISDKNKTEGNAYSWKINGEEIDTPSKRNSLTIRPTATGGYATINLEIENTLKLFQKVAKELVINL